MHPRELMVSSWAVLGVVLLLAEAIVRLSRMALVVISQGLAAHEWVALVVGVVVMGYVEGYRAFSRSFGPRVVARAFELGRARPSILSVLFAPAHAMSLVGDTRKRCAKNWALVAMIVAFVLLVRVLPPTWRAIVDASVALSLSWGTAVICRLWGARLRSELAERDGGASSPPENAARS